MRGKRQMAELIAATANELEKEKELVRYVAPVTAENIKITACYRPGGHGHIGHGAGGKLRVGVNSDWWDKQTNERRLVFIAHELAHMADDHRTFGNGSHTPSFWDVHERYIKYIISHLETFEALYGELDGLTMTRSFEMSVNPAVVDGRCETPDERRSAIYHSFHPGEAADDGSY